MKGMAVVTAIAGLITGAAETIEIPSWWAVVGAFVTSGIYLRWHTARVEKRLLEKTVGKTEAESEEIYQRIARKTAHDLEVMQAKYAELEARYEALEAEHGRSEARHVAERAVHDRERQALRTELRALEEELATTRAQAGLTERRKNP